MFRILAVDDNEDVLSVIRHAAEAAGHDVETVNTGAQFKAAFTRFRPNVVIVDIRVPDMDGIEMVRWLSAAESPPRVILISGDPVGAYRNLADELASVGGRRDVEMLPKPFRIAELLNAIRRGQNRSEPE